MPDIQGPLPLSALRDLLGLVRVLYADWKKNRVGPVELEELRAIGDSLRIAYDLAAKNQANTMGHRAAWSRAEAATAQLGRLIGGQVPLASAVSTASARVVGAPPPPPKFDPNDKIRERFKRG